ncbi:hypothetical protein EV645_3049 [Kribbella rubisoli]|uniref:Lipoprotein n=1 Tax=Kribbella rubisoli TaxID=3075929 RepID=A0A4Q7WY48_9ACTN|nr:hypothetical protein [Kribbella rubisoli]RZU15511.1 hypothetical protein EV645_3049 [Kribbella rubisoli]
MGAAVVVTALLLAVTACGSEDGASASAADTPAAKHSLSGPAEKAKGSLVGLAVLPRGYAADPRANATGPFTATGFLNTWSADPALDRALLLNAGFVEGYRASRLSPDKKKRFTLQLFKTGSAGKAVVLQRGFWNQDTHEHPFDLPGALSDARVEFDGGTSQSTAVAEASLTVGPMVVEISVREVGPIGSNLTPDTALVTALAKEQRARFTATSS